jgi:hypothetical protein
MGTLRFADLRSRSTEVLELTRRTVEEFAPWGPPFEAAFQAPMAHWRLDGRPRHARRYTTEKNCPLPMPEDRLLFILGYLQTSPLQVVQGRRFGRGQSKAPQWLHGLVGGRQTTLHALGDAPPRSVTALAQRLGVAEADAAAMVVPRAGLPTPADPPMVAPAPAPMCPLLATRAPNGAADVLRSRLRRGGVIAARTSATR